MTVPAFHRGRASISRRLASSQCRTFVLPARGLEAEKCRIAGDGAQRSCSNCSFAFSAQVDRIALARWAAVSRRRTGEKTRVIDVMAQRRQWAKAHTASSMAGALAEAGQHRVRGTDRVTGVAPALPGNSVYRPAASGVSLLDSRHAISLAPQRQYWMPPRRHTDSFACSCPGAGCYQPGVALTRYLASCNRLRMAERQRGADHVRLIRGRSGL